MQITKWNFIYQKYILNDLISEVLKRFPQNTVTNYFFSNI